jgi:hypothetical protein
MVATVQVQQVVRRKSIGLGGYEEWAVNAVPAHHAIYLPTETNYVELIRSAIYALDHLVDRHAPFVWGKTAQAVNAPIAVSAIGYDAVDSVTRHVTFLVAKAVGATHNHFA